MTFRGSVSETFSWKLLTIVRFCFAVDLTATLIEVDSGPDAFTDKGFILNSGFKSKEHRTSDSCSFLRVNIFETVEFRGTAWKWNSSASIAKLGGFLGYKIMPIYQISMPSLAPSPHSV